MLDIVRKDSVDRSVTIRIVDSTDGAPETGVVYNTSGIDLWYRREGAAKTGITEATLASLTTAHTDGGFLHVGDGYYRLDLPDAAFASGANYVDVGGTVTDMVVIGGRVRLVNVDIEDAVRGGLTALPNAAANTAGGLASMVRLAGTLPSQTGASAASGTVNLASGGISADNEGVGELLVVFSAAFVVRGAGIITGSANSTDRVTLNYGTALDFTPTNGDTYARLALPGVAGMDAATLRAALGMASANMDTQLSGIQSDTNDIQSRLPSALVSGRMDASVGAMASGVVTAAAVATNAIDADALASDAVAEIQSGLATASALATVAGYVDTEVAAIKAKTDNLPADPADASDIAASFSSVSGTLSTIASYIDTEVAAIKAKTDNLPAQPAAAGDIPSAATVANAVLDATASAHNAAGSIGEKINDIGGGGGSAPTATQIREEMDANSTKLANLDATVSSRLESASYSAAPSASTVAAAVLDAADGIDEGVTVRDALKGLAATQLGKLVISGSTYTFRNLADTADVLVATVNNGRTSITFNP